MKKTATKAVAKTSKPATKKAPVKKYQDGGEKSRLENRLDKKRAKTLAKVDRKEIKAVSKSRRESTLKDSKDDRAKRAQGTISAIRSKKKEVDIKGDRRLVGNNTTNTSVKVYNSRSGSTPSKPAPVKDAPKKASPPKKGGERTPLKPGPTPDRGKSFEDKQRELRKRMDDHKKSLPKKPDFKDVSLDNYRSRMEQVKKEVKDKGKGQRETIKKAIGFKKGGTKKK